MPFHPEELHQHVKELERLYAVIPGLDTNAKTALAKAIISATASFVEGCLDSMSSQTLRQLGIPQVWTDDIVLGLKGLYDKITFVKKRLAHLRSGWQVKDNALSKFIEDRLGENRPGLLKLRNLIDHGNVVAQADLRLNNITYFRLAACTYLEQVYTSLGIGKPGWLGK